MRTALSLIYVELTQMHGCLQSAEGNQAEAQEAIEAAADWIAVAVKAVDGGRIPLERDEFTFLALCSLLNYVAGGHSGFDAKTCSLAKQLFEEIQTPEPDERQGNLEFSEQGENIDHLH